MTNRFSAAVIALAALVLVGWNSFFIVNAREQAVVLRFGEIQRVVDEPGLYFKWPFAFAGADNVQKFPDRLLRFDLEDIRLQVSGGKFYEVDAFLVYNIADAAQFMRTVSGSIEAAEQRLRTRLDAALRRVYGLRGFEAALSEERADMMREVRDQLRPDASSLGIQLNDVRIRRTDLTQEVSQQTYERMQAERLAEAERLRARGQVAAREIRAAADREVVETVAAARRDAEVLQGQGDAERSAIYADAFGRNPEFFDFYRSMQAYRTALENSDTTMVLSPDSEFFRYFEGGIGEAPAVSGAPQTSDGAAGAEVSQPAEDLQAAEPADSADAAAGDGTAAVGSPTQGVEGEVAGEGAEVEGAAGSSTSEATGTAEAGAADTTLAQ